MNQQHDPNQPIEVMIGQIEDAIDFESVGKVDFTPKKVFNTVHNLILDTGVLND